MMLVGGKCACSTLTKSFVLFLRSFVKAILLLAILSNFADASAQCDAGSNDLGGVVWRDYNSNGIREPGEPGVVGSAQITVSAYDGTGLVSQVNLAADGGYSFEDIYAGRSGNNVNIRIEFEGLPNWAKAGVHLQGGVGGTTVQFHQAPTCTADLVVQNPAEYCQDDPLLGIPCYNFGDQVSGAYANNDALVAVKYKWGRSDVTGANGYDINQWRDGGLPIHIAKSADIGSTYGVAWNRTTNTLYASPSRSNQT
jgi:hypothetical protein